MDTRQCKQCLLTKPFDTQFWRVSRGAPAGNFCKECAAVHAREYRNAESYGRKSRSKILLNAADISAIPSVHYVRIAKCVLYLDRLMHSNYMELDCKDKSVYAKIIRHGFEWAVSYYTKRIIAGKE